MPLPTAQNGQESKAQALYVFRAGIRKELEEVFRASARKENLELELRFAALIKMRLQA
jgi:hypothetical protein